MKFTKMHGCGNDYVYVNCFKEQVDDPSKLAVQVSDRHFGIGSDGLILICPSEQADFRMRMFKYVYDYGLTDKTRISIETKGGIKYLDLQVENGKVKTVKVDMGEPILNTKEIPVEWQKEKMIGEKVKINGQEYEMTCVSMGNPHAVVWVDDTASLPLEKIGPIFEKHAMFPERVNTEFVQVLNKKEVNMRVWERGSGETLACGTGACATAVACILNGKTEEEVIIHLLGGDLKTNHVFMTGPATIVFDGEITVE